MTQSNPVTNRRGFTTFELIISLSIMSFLLLIVGNTFSNILFTRNRISSESNLQHFVDQTLLILTQEARWAKEITYDLSDSVLSITTIDDEIHVYQKIDDNLHKTTTLTNGETIDQVINPVNVKVEEFTLENRSSDAIFRPSYEVVLTVRNQYNQPNKPESTYTNKTAITLRNRFPGSV